MRLTNGESALLLVSSDRRNNLRLPDTFQWDFRLGYRFEVGSGTALLGLSATNILDRDNVTHRFFAIEAREKEIVPVDVRDFGFRLSLDLAVRF